MSTLYVVVLTYIKPLEEVDDAIPAHVEWLKKGYADGLFLASGRRLPRTGGVILAKCASRNAGIASESGSLPAVGSRPYRDYSL